MYQYAAIHDRQPADRLPPCRAAQARNLAGVHCGELAANVDAGPGSYCLPALPGDTYGPGVSLVSIEGGGLSMKARPKPVASAEIILATTQAMSSPGCGWRHGTLPENAT